MQAGLADLLHLLELGRFFSRDGALVASTAQEGLVRIWD